MAARLFFFNKLHTHTHLQYADRLCVHPGCTVQWHAEQRVPHAARMSRDDLAGLDQQHGSAVAAWPS